MCVYIYIYIPLRASLIGLVPNFRFNHCQNGIRRGIDNRHFSDFHPMTSQRFPTEGNKNPANSPSSDSDKSETSQNSANFQDESPFCPNQESNPNFEDEQLRGPACENQEEEKIPPEKFQEIHPIFRKCYPKSHLQNNKSQDPTKEFRRKKPNEKCSQVRLRPPLVATSGTSADSGTGDCGSAEVQTDLGTVPRVCSEKLSGVGGKVVKKNSGKHEVKPFTKESLGRLESRTVQLVRDYGFQPRRKTSVEDGSVLPNKFEPFPNNLYGRPLEEIDNFIYDEVTFICFSFLSKGFKGIQTDSKVLDGIQRNPKDFKGIQTNEISMNSNRLMKTQINNRSIPKKSMEFKCFRRNSIKLKEIYII